MSQRVTMTMSQSVTVTTDHVTKCYNDHVTKCDSDQLHSEVVRVGYTVCRSVSCLSPARDHITGVMIEGRAGIAMGHGLHIVAEVMIKTRIRIHISHDRLHITG